MRILTTIASYAGNSSEYLKLVVNELKQVSDVVVFSPETIDIDGVKTEIRDKSLQHGLVFEPRQYILDRLEEYDYFLYNEDDILITPEALLYAVEVNENLTRQNLQYSVGFLRYEVENGIPEFVDLAPYNSVHLGGNGVSDIIRYVTNIQNTYYFNAWNPHSGNFLLSKQQVEMLHKNNHFPTTPQATYVGLLESGATGFCDVVRKYTPVLDYKKLMVHHLSNKYIFNPVKVSTNLLDNFFKFLPEDLAAQYLNL
jgi:hypothetical protein